MPPHLEDYRAQAAKLGLSETEETALLSALWHAVELLIDLSLSEDNPQEMSARDTPKFPDPTADLLGLTNTFNTKEEAP